MIEWIKFDPNNHPPEGEYLVTDGRHADVLSFCSPYGKLEWEELGCMVPKTSVAYVSYYAHINLPREDKDNEKQVRSEKDEN
jgi:hypothetical protein